MHKGEAHAGEPVEVTTQVLAATRSGCTSSRPRRASEDGAVVATGRADAAARRHQGRPRLPGGASRCADRLRRIAAAQRGAAKPADAGRACRRAECRTRLSPMDFALTPEQEMVVETVRGFVEHELYPLEAEVERTARCRPRSGARSRARCRSWASTPPTSPRSSAAAGSTI